MSSKKTVDSKELLEDSLYQKCNILIFDTYYTVNITSGNNPKEETKLFAEAKKILRSKIQSIPTPPALYEWAASHNNNIYSYYLSLLKI